MFWVTVAAVCDLVDFLRLKAIGSPPLASEALVAEFPCILPC